MKIDRLIGITMLLLQKGKVTAPELAERFEVSRRTISRDIEDICRAGIPLVTVQGYGGGISIAEGYRVNKAFLTEAELQAVFAGLTGLDSVSEKPYSQGLREKLSGREMNAQDVFLIDLASFYRVALTEKIERIRRAILGRQRIAFRYFYEKGESARAIEPYRLVFQWSAWYVFGYCMEQEDFRLFKLNRLWNLEVLAEEFSPRELPEGSFVFSGRLAAGNYRLKAVFAASEKYRLGGEYGLDCWTMLEDGRLLLERDFASYTNMRDWVLQFGDKAVVLEPEGLRAEILLQAENILRNYRVT